MADVSLDDLIKKDRETNKVNRLKQVLLLPFQKLKPKKFVNRPNNNQEDRQPKGNQPNKRKPIQKRFNEPADNRRENRGGRDFNDQPRERTKPTKPKFEKREENDENKEKHFRTLRVMGLSPEFTNEDLYVEIVGVRSCLQLKERWRSATSSRTTSVAP